MRDLFLMNAGLQTAALRQYSDGDIRMRLANLQTQSRHHVYLRTNLEFENCKDLSNTKNGLL